MTILIPLTPTALHLISDLRVSRELPWKWSVTEPFPAQCGLWLWIRLVLNNIELIEFYAVLFMSNN